MADDEQTDGQTDGPDGVDIPDSISGAIPDMPDGVTDGVSGVTDGVSGVTESAASMLPDAAPAAGAAAAAAAGVGGMPSVPEPPPTMGAGFPGVNPPGTSGTPGVPNAAPGAPSAPPASGNLAPAGGGAAPQTPAPVKKSIDFKAFIWPAILLIGGAFVLYSCITNTSADSLKVGDCFEIPDEDFSSVKNQGCDGPHEAQIYAELDTLSDDCSIALIELPGLDFDTLPADWNISQISDSETATNVQCVLTSESAGLTASVVDSP